jgi:hypothetical protein
LAALRTNTNMISEDNWNLSTDSNLALPEHKCRVLPLREPAVCGAELAAVVMNVDVLMMFIKCLGISDVLRSTYVCVCVCPRARRETVIC